MICPKILNWFGFNYECPNLPIYSESVCNSNWVTIITGTSVQVCASAKLWMLMNEFAERGKDEQEKKQEKQTNAPKK